MSRTALDALIAGVLPEPTRGLTRDEVAVVLGKPGRPLTTRRVYHLLKVGIHRKGWKEPVKLGAQQMTWGEMVFAHHIQAFWDALADARGKAARATPKQRERAKQDNRAPRPVTYPPSRGGRRFARTLVRAGQDAAHAARTSTDSSSDSHGPLDGGAHAIADCERA